MTVRVNDLTRTLQIAIGIPLGTDIELLLCRDGALRLAHDCVMVRWDTRIRQAPVVYRFGSPANTHIMIDPSVDELTLIPAFRCRDCGLTGQIANGRWFPVAPVKA